MTEKEKSKFQIPALHELIQYAPIGQMSHLQLPIFRTVIDMTSIDRSKCFFQLFEKNIMSINRNTFFQAFTPFLANTNKNFEEKLKYSIKKC